MQFINAFMLLGVLAVAIPVIIQILNRKNSSKIYWGAMIFLLDSMRKRRKRVLLEDILLLACRCLIPALAALALARPFITPESQVPWVVVMPMLLLSITFFGISFALWRYPKWRRWLLISAAIMFVLVIISVVFERQLNLKRFGRGAHKDVVLVVDGSSSMSMVSDGQSNFERACKEAEKYIDGAPKGTSFSILLGGPVPQVLNPVPISDKRVLHETLAQLKPTQGTMQIMGTLTAAAVTLASGNNGVKQIIIIGDGQTVGWNIGAADRWKTIHSIFAQLRNAPQIVWRTLPLPTSIRNLAVSDVKLTRDIVGTDREVGIRVTVENTGTEAVTPDEVVLKIGSVVLSSKAVQQLEPGSGHTVVFNHKFDKPGAALIEATVVSKDDLPADDTFKYVAPVMGSLRVLVVDGSSSANVFEKGSTFISLALRPDLARLQGGTTAAAADFLLETAVEDVYKTATRTSFGGFGVVILADVPKLPDETMKALADYCASGGGLIILPGSKTRPETFNAWIYNGKPVLPLPLGKWKSVDSATTKTTIDPVSFTHDALRNLRTESDLGSVAPLQYWTLDEGVSGGDTVAARLSSGEPFLAIKPLGRGTVAMSAFPFDATASDLPTRRSFVPLMHELTYYLSRPVAADLNIIPSEGATLLLAPQMVGSTSSAGANGLVGMYYKQRGLKGESLRRVDSAVNFDWGGGSPMNGIPADFFSVLWSGTLVPPLSGRYEFYTQADDRATIRIDGKPATGPMNLVAGKKYMIQVTFEDDYAMAYIRLFWKRDGGNDAIIPTEALFPIVSGGGEGSGEIVQIKDPNGETFHGEIFPSDSGTSLRVARSLIPGLYSVEVPELYTAQLASAINSEGRIMFSVVAGTEESTMEAISSTQTDFLMKYISLSTATKEEDVFSTLKGQSFGKEVWRILAIAVFLFLIAEVALTRWISIQRRTGEEENIDFSNEGKAGTASFKSALEKLRGGQS